MMVILAVAERENAYDHPVGILVLDTNDIFSS
jgi:hypothetical protein